MRGFPLVAVLGVAFLFTGCGSQQLPSAPSKEPAVQTATSDSEGIAHTMSACTISSIGSGTWYSQNNPSWSSVLLGNSSTYHIGDSGCILTTLAMVYHDRWGVSTTPPQLNTSAKSAGCFAPGSANINVSCAINSRGGPHAVTAISMSNTATQICAGTPVMVDVTWGPNGHSMLVYHYNGGSTTSMSSYSAIDPWDGTSKSLSSYTATGWRKLQ